LPFVQQQTLWESIDFTGMSEGPNNPTNRTHVHNQRPELNGPHIRSNIVPAYVCPSDPDNDDFNGDTAVTNDGANYGPTGVGQGNPNCLCANNYNSFRPAPQGMNDTNPAGPFTRRAKKRGQAHLLTRCLVSRSMT
jgi:hypothetical protein